jgi:hypothetical protein
MPARGNQAQQMGTGGGAAIPGQVPRKPMAKVGEEDKKKAGDILEEVLRAAEKGEEDKPTDAEGTTVPMGVDDPSYGRGKGLAAFGGKQRAPWTDEHNPTDKPNAQFGSGCGVQKQAAGAALKALLGAGAAYGAYKGVKGMKKGSKKTVEKKESRRSKKLRAMNIR